jgi:hypothetical protein
MSEDIDDQTLVKKNLLVKHPVYSYIKTEDDLRSALRADPRVWDKCNTIFEFFTDTRFPQGAMDGYGASRLIDAISKYDLEGSLLKKFAFTLAKEKGKFASDADDLDRLAKIILAPDLTVANKANMIGTRNSYESLELLEKAVANKQEGWWAWICKKIGGEAASEPATDLKVDKVMIENPEQTVVETAHQEPEQKAPEVLIAEPEQEVVEELAVEPEMVEKVALEPEQKAPEVLIELEPEEVELLVVELEQEDKQELVSEVNLSGITD